MNFVHDKRAVSEVLGAMLIFAMLITGLGVYQAFWVPSANGEVEIQHELDVNDEMVEVRGGVVEAAIGGTETSASVKLGTAYESRTIAVNPPNPVGSLQTSDSGFIEIESGTDDITEDVLYSEERDETINETRSLIYTPEYNEHEDSGSIIYEHTGLYQDFGHAQLERSGQRLVEDDTITILPLWSDFDERGIQTESLEFRYGFLNHVSDVENPTISLPVYGENENSYWVDQLSDELDESDVVKEYDLSIEEGLLTIDIIEGTLDIVGAPVGINEDPPGGERDDPDQADDGDNNEAGTLNPSIVLLENSGKGNNGDEVDLTFSTRNEEEVEFVEVRFNLMMSTHQTDTDPVENITEIASADGGVTYFQGAAERGGSFEDIDDESLLIDSTGLDVTLTFNEEFGGGQGREIIGLTFLTDDGMALEYLIET